MAAKEMGPFLCQPAGVGDTIMYIQYVGQMPDRKVASLIIYRRGGSPVVLLGTDRPHRGLEARTSVYGRGFCGWVGAGKVGGWLLVADYMWSWKSGTLRRGSSAYPVGLSSKVPWWTSD